MRQVLILPSWGSWLNNRLFDEAEGCVYSSAFRLWRDRAAKHGYALDTWDMKPLAIADCLWVMDLPGRKSVFERAKKNVGRKVFQVLQILESPVVAPQNFIEANRCNFNSTISYEPGLDERANCYSYHLPNVLTSLFSDLSFNERRNAVMINSNRVEGYFSMRQPGLEGLPGFGRYLSGWKIPGSYLLGPARGELYSWRRELAKAADKLGANYLDVYGKGWKGEQISWFPFYKNSPYRCATNAPHTCLPGSENRESKYELLSRYRFGIGVENFRGNLGYISEKMFDVLAAGSVPVYLGDEAISDYLPQGSFVDVRNFRDHRELLLYLSSCSESEWMGMREAGQNYLRSERFYRFTDEAFAERMVEIMKRIL